MTLFQVEELCGYWAEHPPAHLAVAALLGGRAMRRRPPSPQRGDVEAVAAELGPGIGAGDVHAGLPPVVLAFEQLKQTAERTRQ